MTFLFKPLFLITFLCSQPPLTTSGHHGFLQILIPFSQAHHLQTLSHTHLEPEAFFCRAKPLFLLTVQRILPSLDFLFFCLQDLSKNESRGHSDTLPEVHINVLGTRELRSMSTAR